MIKTQLKPSGCYNQAPNCLTVDVEDYFHVTAFEDRICRKDWDKYECRVESNTNHLLSIFDDVEVRGTFFVLGWVAERYPALIRRILEAGHEIACHGYWHQLIYNLKPEEFEKDILDSKEAIYNACGVEVTAYRAPSFSIVPSTRWALDILAENGFKTDSSIFPIAGHDRYGDPSSPKAIHGIETRNGLITEFPPTAGEIKLGMGQLPLPIGGGYFRLLPLRLTQLAINQVRAKTRPAMFYIHPWELDPEQPKIDKLSKRSRFRHYIGLNRTESKLKKLLQSNPFCPLKEIASDQFLDDTQDTQYSNLEKTSQNNASQNSLVAQR